MIAVLSPAKSMCVYRASPYRATCPVLLDRTDELLTVMRSKTEDDFKKMMKLSDALASLTYDRYQDFIESSEAEAAVTATNNKISSLPTTMTVTAEGGFKITALLFDGPVSNLYSPNTSL